MPNVIPLQSLGVIDTDLTNVSANELHIRGLINMWSQGREGMYLVQHGTEPVRDFPTFEPGGDNYWEKAFPILYPYGTGGIEVVRPVKLSLIEQTRWSLQQHDRRFRHHQSFVFIACNQQQRRDALNSCSVLMRRRDFEEHARKFANLTVQDLEKAAEEESKGLPISNPNARDLIQLTFGTASRVIAADSIRNTYRKELRSASVYFGPPSVWITINPDDLNDPIAQVFVGEDIDLDNFAKTHGPSKQERARNVARDGFAAAKYFHFIINTVLETLIGVKASSKRFENTKGIFGVVEAYYGTVECQGRGSLHVHLLLFLKGAPSWSEMQALLKTEEFREKVKAFMRANFRAHYPELQDKDSIEAIPTDSEVAYSRPIHPAEDEYWQKVYDEEVKVVRTKQMHTCTPQTCLITDKRGTRCKRRAPWTLSADDVVDESGKWLLKRSYEYQNGSVPAFAANLKCNNDGKPLLNGPQSAGTTWYICTYATKKFSRSTNYSALFAKETKRMEDENERVADLMERSRKLVFRCTTAIMREQELPMSLCVSYVMGWGDVFRSHHFVNINWTSFHKALTDTYNEMGKQ